jgi:hypothetical protein
MAVVTWLSAAIIGAPFISWRRVTAVISWRRVTAIVARLGTSIISWRVTAVISWRRVTAVVTATATILV